MSTKRTPKNIFVPGPLPTADLAESIGAHGSKTGIGAHAIFLGQVRADSIDGKRVVAIHYEAYESMALQKMHEIRESIFAKFPLECLHVSHSLGRVAAGELCLSVFVSSTRRRAALDACDELVERIKAELPIWGKEIFETDEHRWKENTSHEQHHA